MKINWITIRVSKFEESKKFYAEYLAMKPEKEFSPAESMSIAFMSADNGMQIELIYDENLKVEPYTNTNISIGASSEDYDNLLRIARSKELISAEPTVLGGHLECFFVNDPDGNSIQIAREKNTNS